MHIKLVAIGKIKEAYIKRGIEEYQKRISRYATVDIVELPEEDIAARPESEVKEREARKIQKHLALSWYVIALDREGKELSSVELSRTLESLMLGGKSDVVFVLGGPLGLDRSILDAADAVISLSRLTFTHQLARLILLEQVYRSFKIIKGEPYHY